MSNPAPSSPIGKKRSRRIVGERAWLTKLEYTGKEYESTPRGFVHWKRTNEGLHLPGPLTNFTARIIEDLILDDGVETQRAFRIEAVLDRGKRRNEIMVPVAQFGLMNWPTEMLGRSAIVKTNCRDRAREAILQLSHRGLDRTIYRHLGWRQISGQWVYLHAAGAIGARGTLKSIDTQLSPSLCNYILPDPPRGAQMVAAVDASLKMLDLAPDRITIPIFSAIWRAILRECDLAVFASGRTQSGKSELTALAQQHFGAAMTRKKLPANFLSTANAIERLAFEAKDAILTIDDFNPIGTPVEVQKMHSLAERIFRGQGNLAARNRLTSDITLRPGTPPRGMYMSSGEDIPRGHSLRARIVKVEIAPGEVRKHLLTQCQQDALNGLYTQTTAAFVRWLAPRIQESERMLIEEVMQLREAGDDGSNLLRRSPDNVYQLAAGFKIFPVTSLGKRASRADDITSTCRRRSIANLGRNPDERRVAPLRRLAGCRA